MARSAIDTAIATLAGRQHGNVARRQLLKLGISHSAINWRVKRSLLIPTFPGVFSVGHKPTTVLAWAAAAVLACGDDAVLSHDSAAALWEMGPRLRRPFHVTGKTYRQIPSQTGTGTPTWWRSSTQ